MIVVTGGSGFLGRHLIRVLVERYRSTPLRIFDLRPPADPPPEGVEFVGGSIEDSAAVAAAVRGARIVVHLAARVEPASQDRAQLTRVNTEGAHVVFMAAVRAGCELFLHMSSAGVYGLPRGSEPFREDDPLDPVTPYQRTKLEAEERLRGTDAASTTLIVLRPAGIYGSGSRLELASYKTILRQRLTVELRGGVIVHPTHTSDVAEAIVALIDSPAPHGSVFNLGGERPVLLQELHAITADVLGVSRRRIILPTPVAVVLAAVVGPVLSAAGRPKPHLHAFSAGRTISSAVDDRRFRRRYPAAPVLPLQSGIQEHVDWARAHDLL
jgi:nucleoside-diphosphate-sugar epimerase